MKNSIADLMFMGLSGKNFQIELLMGYMGKNYPDVDIIHLCTGDKSRAARENNLYVGELFSEFMNAGNLLPDGFVNSFIWEELRTNLSKNSLVFYNGWIRTKEQGLEYLKVARFFNRKELKIIYQKVSLETMINRTITGQRNRSDDGKIEVYKKRFQEFEEKTLPALEFLGRHYDILEINGEQEPQAVHQEILGKLAW